MQRVSLSGMGTLQLPPSFHVARTLEDQIDALYDAADAPLMPRHAAERYLKLAGNLLKIQKANAVKEMI